MATGEQPLITSASTELPSTGAQEKSQLPDILGVEEGALTASPRLSRKAQDEIESCSSEDDPENYPLHTPWTFWFDRSVRGSTAHDYFANLRPIITVRTIKAFWAAFNNIHSADQLNERESYHLMRGEKRRPVWEDVDNADGGQWTFKIKKEETTNVWQELLLAAIGEQFSKYMAEGDDVCGVSVRIRGFDNSIQIWNEDSELHSKSLVIQRVKELIPSIEINEWYQSNKARMRESLNKPQHSMQPPGFFHHHHGAPPPPHYQKRYTGAPAPLHGPAPPRPMFRPGPPPPGTMYSGPPPHFRPRSFHHNPHPPYPPS